MEVSRTSMIHEAAPHFLWTFAIWYVAHQLNLRPRVSLPETSPTLGWRWKVGDASMFRFYLRTSRRIFPPQDITLDESVPFYRLFPYRSAPPPPSPLFLAPGPPPIDPLPPQGPAPSVSGGAEPGGAEPRGAEPGGAEPAGVEPGGAELEAVEPGGAESEGAESRGSEPRGSRGAAAAGPRGARTRGTGVAGTSIVRGAGAGGAATRDHTEPGGAGTGGTGASGTRAGGDGAGALGAVGARAGGFGTGSASAGGAGAGGAVSHGTGRRVPRPRPPLVPDIHAMALRPSCVPLRVPLLAPPESAPPAIPDPESDRACAACPTVSRLLATVITNPSFESTTASVLVAELLEFASACSLYYTTALAAESESASPLSVRDIPTPRSYAEAITGPYSSKWHAAMDAKFPSWKSTGTYVDAIPPSRANIIDGMWIFRVKQPPGSPHAYKGSLHEEIWLRRPPGFTRSFPPGTQWSLRRPVYGLRQVPREWHNTLRTTLAALAFAPSTADPSLFLRTDTSLPPFYVLLYVDDTGDTNALTLVLQCFGFQYSSPLPTPPSTSHSLSAPPSDESVEPSGPYPELVDCLMYLMTCTRPDLAYPLSLLARYVAPATQRSSQGYTFSLGSGSVSWRSTRLSSVLSSSCEAEIYARAMAAQELRWLTYLLTDLGEQPRSPPVLYVENKAMIALCHEDRPEHRTKHITLQYFLAREVQQRGQLPRGGGGIRWYPIQTWK
ncbi:unnamed protein product [Closterium sp. NIES-53]